MAIARKGGPVPKRPTGGLAGRIAPRPTRPPRPPSGKAPRPMGKKR